MMGYPIDWTKVDNTSSTRVKALGNAIVPQVAFEIFKAIAKTEEDLNQQPQ